MICFVADKDYQKQLWQVCDWMNKVIILLYSTLSLCSEVYSGNVMSYKAAFAWYGIVLFLYLSSAVSECQKSLCFPNTNIS